MLKDQDLLSIQEVRTKVDRAYEAWQNYRRFTQSQIDSIVEAMGARARAHARRLAELAVEETGMGNVDDKVAKNLLNADLLVRSIRGMKTVGVLNEIPEQKLTEIGVPVGVIAAILPTTNPTSTAIYKSVISLKAGNAVVLSPHPRAKRSTCATAELLMDAARDAGAPEGIIQWIATPSLEGTNALMRHPKTGVILSTGGSGIVKAAYSSGKPAFGVGPGNVPVLLDPSYPLDDAIAGIVAGKSFDYGTVCSSEQTLVAERSLRDRVLAELKVRKAFLLNDAQRVAVEKTLFTNGTTVRAECVGQSPQKIAQMAGFSVPADVKILVAEIHGVGKEHPLSAEKLSPVLAVLFVDTFDAAVDACEGILKFGGLGHTCAIFANNEDRVRAFGLRMPAFRVLVNTPSPQGSTGITTSIQPAMTLGCGAMAGNITSDNVGPRHLINIKRIAWKVRTPEEAFPSPPPSDLISLGGNLVIDRDALMSAIEKYLSERGVAVAGATPAPSPVIAPVAPAAQQKPSPAPLRPVIEGVVDRFLTQRRAASTAAAPVPAGCGCGVKSTVVADSRSVAATPAPSPGAAAAPVAPSAPKAPTASVPAPEVQIVDFVCENDVRAAMTQNKKIYIGPKTIVTPAARELAARDEILVQAQR